MAKKRVFSHEEKKSEKWKIFSFHFLPVLTIFPRDCLHSIKRKVQYMLYCTPSVAPYELPKIVGARQVENSFFKKF